MRSNTINILQCKEWIGNIGERDGDLVCIRQIIQYNVDILCMEYRYNSNFR